MHMRVLVLYSHRRRGSTYHCVQAFLEGMSSVGEFEWEEYDLENALPQHCRGCFDCFLRDADQGPHHGLVQPLVDAMLAADAILLSSPVYGLDVSGIMKTMIDHTCYMWLAHRPEPPMFQKVGAVFTTAAGAGVSRTLKTMRQALKQLGLKRVEAYGFRIAAAAWEDVAPTRRARIRQRLVKAGQRFYRQVNRRRQLRRPLPTYLMFLLLRRLIAGYEADNRDRQHWVEQGWLSGSTPWRT